MVRLGPGAPITTHTSSQGCARALLAFPPSFFFEVIKSFGRHTTQAAGELPFPEYEAPLELAALNAEVVFVVAKDQGR